MPIHFPIGKLGSTHSAMAAFSPDEMQACLNRHMACDWGDLSERDKRANNMALKTGARILSEYVFGKGTANERTLWILTEADRSVTTILLPKDY